MSDCEIYGNKNWQRAVDKASDKPAATVHGTGSGEATDHVRDYILPVYESRAKIMATVSYHDFAKDKCRCGGCWLYRQLERLGDALALLRAAERQK